jgi:hypothetical protein
VQGPLSRHIVTRVADLSAACIDSWAGARVVPSTVLSTVLFRYPSVPLIPISEHFHARSLLYFAPIAPDLYPFPLAFRMQYSSA